MTERIVRRTFLERAALAALGAAAVVRPRDTNAQIAVPNSACSISYRTGAPSA